MQRKEEVADEWHPNSQYYLAFPAKSPLRMYGNLDGGRNKSIENSLK